MPFPIAAVLANVGAAYSQPTASGGAPPGLFGSSGSLFELESLTKGPSASDPYGQFKPGGSFAPPTLTAVGRAFKGQDTGATFLSAIAPGFGQAISGMLSGPGRGNARRKGARQMVETSPLALIRQTVLSAVPKREAERTPEGIAAAVRAALADPQARAALTAVLQRGQQLGGFGSAQGEEANQLGDVLKFTFGLGTVPDKRAPTVDAIFAALAGTGAPPATPSPVAPAPAERTLPGGFAGAASFAPADTPQGVLSQLRDFVAGGPAATEVPMPTFLDSLGGFTGGGGVASPFQMPGGMPQGGGILGQIGTGIGSVLGGILGGVLPGGAAVLAQNAGGVSILERARREIGVPFVDVTPSGSSELFEPYRLTPSGARAQLHVQMNPATGKAEFFGPLGRPVLFSRDVAVTRRVGRLARRLGAVSGINRGRSVRRRRGGR